MKHEVQVPQIGESISSGLLATWLKQDGDTVAEGDELFELETDKATLAVPSPAAGVLSIQVKEDSEVQVGQVVAAVDSEAASHSRPEPQSESDASDASSAAADAAPGADEGDSSAASDGSALSPAVRRIVAEHKLDPAAIKGSGPSGRITKADALAAVSAADTEGAPAEPAEPRASAQASGAEPSADRQRRVKMSNLRRRVAENLVQSRQNAAHLSTFNEVDMSQVMALRSQHKERFAERHGVKLGFMSFFVAAAVRALQQFEAVNAFVDGTDIVYNNYYNVGVALSTDKGLIVPVIRDADRKGFADIESEILSFLEKARARRLNPDELTGGTFTISNGGVFGSMLSTPIPNPPQTGILGMHSIQKRAMVVEDQIVVRPMMYLALTYDHRIIDGKEAVGFLGKIKQLIEDPSRMLLDL